MMVHIEAHRGKNKEEKHHGRKQLDYDFFHPHLGKGKKKIRISKQLSERL